MDTKLIAAESSTRPTSGEVIAPLRSVQAELGLVEQELVESIPDSLGLVSKASRAILQAGGKRLRPALVLLTSRAFGGMSTRAISVATSLEMVHGASLLHDDVVDNARTRRGRVTIGEWWSNKVSVMLGDYLYTRSLLEMCADDNRLLVSLVAEATGRMVLGQIREIEEQNNFDVTVDDYLFIIREKTAVLMSVACRMGAIVAGASRESIDAMAEYGMLLGMAFQIVDDVLDFWGDEEHLGKPVGSDLSERKFTLPFIHALSQMSDEQRETVRTLLGDPRPRLGRRAVRRIVSILDALGSADYSRAVAAEYCARAREALRAAHLPQGQEDLESLIDYVLERRI